MAEPLSSGSDEKHGHASGTRTETLQECPVVTNDAPVLHLRLNQPKTGSKVKWTTDTVDNEFMGKKKSKCCCIFEKPKVFGESSSSSEEDGDVDGCTDHCKGHKKKCYRKTPSHKHDHDHNHQGGAGPDSKDDSKTV